MYARLQAVTIFDTTVNRQTHRRTDKQTPSESLMPLAQLSRVIAKLSDELPNKNVHKNIENGCRQAAAGMSYAAS